MFGVVILPVHFRRGLFCCSNFNFFYIDDKIETSLIARSSHSNLELFLRGDTHMTSTLTSILSDVRGGGYRVFWTSDL